MIIELLVTTEDGQKLAGKLMNNGNKILAQASKGYEQLVKSVLEEEVLHDGMVITKANPKEWLQELPKHLSGSYLRAKRV